MIDAGETVKAILDFQQVKEADQMAKDAYQQIQINQLQKQLDQKSSSSSSDEGEGEEGAEENNKASGDDAEHSGANGKSSDDS